jgi:prepilin-type N-terminal cleavage/methylation domain-containing protein
MSCGRPIGFVLGRPPRRRGFTLIELVVTMAVVLITTIIAVPLVQNVSGYFKLRGAVSTVTGAIQSARYQAIFQGCPYQVAFTSATGIYQVQNEPYSGVTGLCAAAFSNVCTGAQAACPVPLSGSGNAVALNADATLTMSPGGKIQGAAACPCTMVLTYSNRTATILVSSYGNISVTYVP